MHDDRADQSFGGNLAAVGEDGKAQIAQDLQRIDPGFDRTGLVAKQAGLFPDRGQKLPGTRRAGERRLLPGRCRACCFFTQFLVRG